eukprot:1757349-Pleurochrysis_carterae.AAC.1
MAYDSRRVMSSCELAQRLTLKPRADGSMQLSDGMRAKWRRDYGDASGAFDNVETDVLILNVALEGALNAAIQLRALDNKADGGAAAVVPTRIVLGPSEGANTLELSHHPNSHVWTELSFRAGLLLVSLDTLPAADRLPRLLTWLQSYQDLFSAECCYCGRVLASSTSNPAALLPPTIRTVSRAAYHVHCYAAHSGRRDSDAEWCSTSTLKISNLDA